MGALVLQAQTVCITVHCRRLRATWHNCNKALPTCKLPKRLSLHINLSILCLHSACQGEYSACHPVLPQETQSYLVRLQETSAELQTAHKAAEDAAESTAVAEARIRDLYDANTRLEAHVADLESRKRAPLYQKKQEEELKAAVEKAQECEVKAQEAELKAREAKVSSDTRHVHCTLQTSTLGVCARHVTQQCLLAR